MSAISIYIRDAEKTFTELESLFRGGPTATVGSGRQNIMAIATYFHEIAVGKRTAAIKTRISPTDPVRASRTGTFTGLPVADETITLAGTAFTFKASASTEAEITIGADATATAANCVTKVNAHSVVGKFLIASSAAGVLTIASRVPGVIGNALTLAEAASNFTWAGTTLTGGAGGDDTLSLDLFGSTGGAAF